MSYKTTKKDFAEFKKECEKWIEYFHLNNYEHFFAHEDAKGRRARCWYDLVGRVTTIILGTKWEEVPEKHEIRRAAFHEACELLLSGLVILAENMFDKNHVAKQTHEIIRRLENTIFKESL